MALTERQTEIAKIFARLSRTLNRYPSRSELKKEGIPRDGVRDHFGDMDGLRDKARDAFPNYFEDLIDPEYFSTETFNELKAKTKKYKRFFVSTYVPGGLEWQDALESVEVWCKKKKGMSLFIPANYALLDLPREFVENHNIVFKDLKLNSNVWISAIKIDPKQMDPSQNMDLIASREGTMIIGSPKQRLRPVANSNTKLPHFIQATGAITKPRYITKVAFGRSSERRDYLAKTQHIMGGIIIEIYDDKFYNFRQVQFDKDGSFIDLFERFSGEDGMESVGCEAVIQGDYHDGETDPKADRVADELCAVGKPKYRVFHDFFNGKSISHHDKDQQVLQAIKAGKNELSLATELHNMKMTIARKLKPGNEVLVFSRSNHDEFLHRYLQKGEFEDQNRLLATKLQVAAMEGKDPLVEAMRMMGLKDMSRVRFLQRDEDMKITPKKIAIDPHGDLGANGKRNPGSAGMLKTYGDCAYGHCHFPEINHGAWSVGTSSYLKLSYNAGGSSWAHAHQVIYANGTRQIIIAINGKYKLVD